jgi:Mg-chelatase subunit ChlD
MSRGIFMHLNGFKAYTRDVRGNTAVIFGLAALPLMIGAGAAIDMVRANDARTLLQGAADAAALAGSLAKNEPEAVVSRIVTDYLKANGAENVLSSVERIKHVRNPARKTFRVTIEGKLDTSLMALAGISDMELSAMSEVRSGGSALEVALVLDNTASMNAAGRLPALKSAAKDLVDQVLASAGQDTYVRIGIVPFAQYVNIGMGNRNKLWMNVPADSTTTQNVCNSTYPNATSSNCRMENGSWDNDGVPVPYTYEVCDWNYGAAVTTCADQTWDNKWYGCVGSRLAPMDSRINGLAKKYPGIQNVSCTNPITLLTDDQGMLNAQIDSMVGVGETYIAPGVLWGWNLLDAGEPLGGAKNAKWMKANDGVKAMVVMTDGANTISADNQYHWGRDKVLANEKTAEVCNNAKADGIKVYTVAFMVDDAAAQTLLTNCASEPGMAYTADDATALSEAFSQIAGSLMAAHLSK